MYETHAPRISSPTDGRETVLPVVVTVVGFVVTTVVVTVVDVRVVVVVFFGDSVADVLCVVTAVDPVGSVMGVIVVLPTAVTVVVTAAVSVEAGTSTVVFDERVIPCVGGT